MFTYRLVLTLTILSVTCIDFASSSTSASVCARDHEKPNTEYHYAACLYGDGNFTSAAHVLEAFLENQSNPESNAYRLLGDVYLSLQRSEDAIHTLQQARRLDPEDVWTKNSLSNAFFARAMELSPIQIKGKTIFMPDECKPNAALIAKADEQQSAALTRQALTLAKEVKADFDRINKPLLAAHKQAFIGMMMIEQGEFDEAVQQQINAAESMIQLSRGTDDERFYSTHAAHIYANVSNQYATENDTSMARFYGDLALETAPDDSSRTSIEKMLSNENSVNNSTSSYASVTGSAPGVQAKGNFACQNQPILVDRVDLEEME